MTNIKKRFSRLRKNVFIRQTLVLVGILVIIIGIFSHLTNPFMRFSLVQDHFSDITQDESGFRLTQGQSLQVRESAVYRKIALAKSGWHIFAGKLTGGQKTTETSVDAIISEILTARFDPENPYLISGDHFSVFYPRSFGIFYNTILDPRTSLSEADWENRQLIMLKSLAFSLSAFANSDHLSTTIVPVGPKSVALINFYAYPSDTLYSLLYALNSLQSSRELESLYPFSSNTARQLQSATASAQLLELHKSDLKRHLETYVDTVVDPDTGLVRSDLALSSTKDAVVRQSSLYDNVILWATLDLANKLEIVHFQPSKLEDLKTTIIDKFWLEEKGYFLDQLNPKAVLNQDYSSDWLIMPMTGFLRYDNPKDREYLVSVVEYIRRNALDQPFPIQYHADQRPWQMHLLPRVLASRYQSTSIWSNWGIEYIKLLTTLAKVTNNQSYLDEARRHLASYSFNIKRYRGFPELYDQDGDYYRQTIYKSVRQTGWVVNYLQARAMIDASEVAQTP